VVAAAVAEEGHLLLVAVVAYLEAQGGHPSLLVAEEGSPW